jgi:hypothetical protein
MAQPDLLSQLRRSPSKDLWYRVIHGILGNEYDEFITHLGAAEDFVSMNIAESLDARLSKAEFALALDDFVTAWPVNEAMPPNSLLRLLHIISAFSPPSGYHQVLGQLRQWGHFHILSESGVVKSDEAVLQAALVCLENYFPAVPVSEKYDEAFRDYKNFLISKIQDERVGAYACARLIELGLFSYDTDQVRVLLEARPEKLISAVGRRFLHKALPHRDVVMSELYRDCIRLRLGDLFEEVMSSLGASVSHEDQLRLILPNGNNVTLYLDQETIERYWPIRQRRDSRGMQRIKEIVQETNTDGGVGTGTD